MKINDFIQQCQQRVDHCLEQLLPNADQEPTQLHAAMAYSVLSQGKRIRPVLVYGTGLSLGASWEQLDAAACAVELIHAYSLIHDDLPAMDDDDLRRGRPTCHKAFNEGIAILAGDTLQSFAFEILAGDTTNDSQTCLAMIRCLTQACGHDGMAGGQALDLWATNSIISPMQVEAIHKRKTGALIHACIKLGYISAQCKDSEIIANFDRFGHGIGLAFQIHDDILDIEGETTILGKQQGADQKKQKATYPRVMGLEASKRCLADEYDHAITALKQLPLETDLLQAIANYMVQRDR